MLWLDHLLFGNGHGMKSPYCDNRFYWLSGRLYTWIGGHGAQLQSCQWTHPKAGERRILCGLKFHPFRSERCLLRVRVSWATSLPHDLNEANAFLRRLEATLGGVFPMDRFAPASCDTHPKGGDPAQTGAPFMSGAVLSDSEGDAQPIDLSDPSHEH